MIINYRNAYYLFLKKNITFDEKIFYNKFRKKFIIIIFKQKRIVLNI